VPQNGQNAYPKGAIRPHDVHTRYAPAGPTIPGIPIPGLHAMAIAPPTIPRTIPMTPSPNPP